MTKYFYMVSYYANNDKGYIMESGYIIAKDLKQAEEKLLNLKQYKNKEIFSYSLE